LEGLEGFLFLLFGFLFLLLEGELLLVDLLVQVDLQVV